MEIGNLLEGFIFFTFIIWLFLIVATIVLNFISSVNNKNNKDILTPCKQHAWEFKQIEEKNVMICSKCLMIPGENNESDSSYDE